MIEGINAAFTFEEFKVPSFQYSEPKNNNNRIKIGFDPSGVFNEKEGVFTLSIDFYAIEDIDSDPTTIFKLVAISAFKFEAINSFEAIPEYFYQSCLAVTFPYIRAFISTMTLQANTKLLKIGLLNLTGLEDELKNKVEVI